MVSAIDEDKTSASECRIMLLIETESVRAGQQRTGHERLSVLHHVRQVRLPRRQARRLRQGPRRPPGRAQDRERADRPQQQTQNPRRRLAVRRNVNRLTPASINEVILLTNSLSFRRGVHKDCRLLSGIFTEYFLEIFVLNTLLVAQVIKKSPLPCP